MTDPRFQQLRDKAFERWINGEISEPEHKALIAQIDQREQAARRAAAPPIKIDIRVWPITR